MTGDLDALTPTEHAFAIEMRNLGNIVEVLPPSNTGRTPDLKINGRDYELKTVSGVEKTDASSLSGAVANRIMNGRGQSADIIVDARQQPGMTREIGYRAIGRAYGLDNRSKKSIQSVTILTPNGVVHAPRRS